MRKINSVFLNNNGVTLVEVLASIVIISIILMGVFSLLTFTNKSAVSNNSKLVAINLAKASIERMKMQPENYFRFEDVTATEKIYTKNNCVPANCDDLFELTVNDQVYDIEIQISQQPDEKELELIDILVTVTLHERNIKSTVEGYINYATYEE